MADDICSTSGCGRRSSPKFPTCCRSCPYLRKRGIRGHEAYCDVRDSDGQVHPWYWQSHDESFLEQVEGAYVESMGTKLIQATLPDFEVIKCVRVENSTLWKTYAQRRAEIRSKGSEPTAIKPETSKLLEFSAVTTLDASVNEVWLFHGTNDDAAQAIARTDFRLPVSSGTGAMLGNGLYFAENAVKSHHYSKKNDDGHFVMLLCRVTLGNILDVGLVGGGGRSSAEQEVTESEKYDSLVGTTRVHEEAREFLVYDISQVYPEYIMYYRFGAMSGPAMQAKISTAFRSWDADGDGFIGGTELHEVLVKIGLAEEDVAVLIEAADVNKDGRIDYNEFVAWLCSDATESLRDKLLEEDPNQPVPPWNCSRCYTLCNTTRICKKCGSPKT